MTEEYDLAGNLFTRHNARVLLNGKYILFIGDSVQRGAYKDLVALLDDGSLLTDQEKKAKLEASFRGDHLLARTEAHNNTNFTEIREWVGPSEDVEWSGSIMIRFVFTTRVWNDFVKTSFDILSEDWFPDIICANSTFWDISRYGDKSYDSDKLQRFPQFEANISTFMKEINARAKVAVRRNKLTMPSLRIWRNALPIGRNARGGLLIEEVQFGTDSEVYRMDLSQANLNIKERVDEAKWDLLDGQYYFRKLQAQPGMREKDGVHWHQIAHRWLTNIFLTHICLAWEVKPPELEKHDHTRPGGVPVMKTIDGIRRMFEQYTHR